LPHSFCVRLSCSAAGMCLTGLAWCLWHSWVVPLSLT
jgi:hypothetical protein